MGGKTSSDSGIETPAVIVVTATESAVESESTTTATLQEVANSSTVTLVPSPPPRPDCITSEYISLGNGLSGFKEEQIEPGAIRIFSHCPPISPIKYDDITVDDNLEKVELVCIDSETDITNYFFPKSVPDENLMHFQSELIDVPEGCRIDFTVKDTLGVNIAIRIMASSPP